jgi:hypothetical protein
MKGMAREKRSQPEMSSGAAALKSSGVSRASKNKARQQFVSDVL